MHACLYRDTPCGALIVCVSGVIGPSPITGQPERYFPPLLRLPRYALSGVVMLAMLAGLFALIIFSLNLQVCGAALDELSSSGGTGWSRRCAC